MSLEQAGIPIKMECEEFRRDCKKYITDGYVPRFDDEHYSAWVEHMATCRECSDLNMALTLAKESVNISDFPCVHIAYYSFHQCDVHVSPWDCAETTLVISNGRYGIPVRDGGESYIGIYYCPWCGVSLYQKANK